MEFSTKETTQHPKAIVIHSHPPVTSALIFAVIATVLVAGTVLSRDDNNALVAYDGTAEAVAVLLEDLDTTEATVGKVLVHGAVDATLLTPNTPATLLSLSQNSIYA